MERLPKHTPRAFPALFCVISMMSACPGPLMASDNTSSSTLFHCTELPRPGHTEPQPHEPHEPHQPLRHTLHSMHLSPLALLLLAGAVVGCVAVTTMLHGFRGCAVREFTFVAQKPGCRSLRISTEACWGRCHTWEKPVVEPPYIQRHHRVCTYSRTRPMTARLPGCLPHISPLYHYPLALHCHCAVCSTLDTECETY